MHHAAELAVALERRQGYPLRAEGGERLPRLLN
jgi:hypothetical protein